MNRKIQIRLAIITDIPQIINIFEDAKDFIKSYHSPQWQNNYPNEEVIRSDIDRKSLYVLELDGEVVACATALEYEKTYDIIENGEWIHNGDYLVIHRLATLKKVYGQGFAKEIINYLFDLAKSKGDYSIKVDTHELNVPMQNLLKSLGFQYCGIIYLNAPTDNKRLAFEKY